MWSLTRFVLVFRVLNEMLNCTRTLVIGRLFCEPGVQLGRWGQPCRSCLVEVQEMVTAHTHTMLRTVWRFLYFYRPYSNIHQPYII